MKVTYKYYRHKFFSLPLNAIYAARIRISTITSPYFDHHGPSIWNDTSRHFVCWRIQISFLSRYLRKGIFSIRIPSLRISDHERQAAILVHKAARESAAGANALSYKRRFHFIKAFVHGPDLSLTSASFRLIKKKSPVTLDSWNAVPLVELSHLHHFAHISWANLYLAPIIAE